MRAATQDVTRIRIPDSLHPLSTQWDFTAVCFKAATLYSLHTVVQFHSGCSVYSWSEKSLRGRSKRSKFSQWRHQPRNVTLRLQILQPILNVPFSFYFHNFSLSLFCHTHCPADAFTLSTWTDHCWYDKSPLTAVWWRPRTSLFLRYIHCI